MVVIKGDLRGFMVVLEPTNYSYLLLSIIFNRLEIFIYFTDIIMLLSNDPFKIVLKTINESGVQVLEKV